MNPMRGIAFKVLSVILFLAMFTCIKRTADTIPPGEAVFFRSFFALPPILVWIAWRGGPWRHLPKRLATGDPFSHLWRGLVGTCAMSLGFIAIARLPLSEAVAIGYATPLLVTVFAAMFLGERVRLYRLGAVGLGFIGVLLVLSPQFAAHQGLSDSLDDTVLRDIQMLGALAASGGAVMAALAQVFVRKMIRTEMTSAIVFWFSVSSATLALATVPFGWTWPDIGTGLLLIAAGLFGGVGQIFVTESYRHAEIAVIAPFEYTSMLFAIGIGFFLFDEIPTRTVLTGAALVITAGCFIVWREHKLGIAQREARALVPPPQG